jgi:hypothetical protein
MVAVLRTGTAISRRQTRIENLSLMFFNPEPFPSHLPFVRLLSNAVGNKKTDENKTSFLS